MIANFFLIFILEVLVRIFANLLDFPPTLVQTSNQMGMKFNYLTGYYNDPYQTEEKNYYPPKWLMGNEI